MGGVTVIGLGAMGSALATAFVHARHDVVVWNRTPSRMSPLISLGASGLESLPDALHSSPVIVVCIDNYAATKALLGDAGVSEALMGKTLIQFSTGTPKEARESEAWLRDLGVTYLDGAILPYPEDIGADDAKILIAGPEGTFQRLTPLLACLAGDLRYVGENIAAAAVLDMAFLTQELCGYLGALHGAQVCLSEGVHADTLAALYAERDPSGKLVSKIGAGAYGDPGATLVVWNAALSRILEQGRERGINIEIPGLISSLFERAIAKGHGESDVAAVIEVLRSKDGR
jgi:3-hydroxyisobutyrate dehydrogenase-like beta-hydroxyacid dehydrogenase